MTLSRVHTTAREVEGQGREGTFCCFVSSPKPEEENLEISRKI